MSCTMTEKRNGLKNIIIYCDPSLLFEAHTEKEEELIKLVNYLDKASTTYGMEISAERTNLMTNDTRGISSDIAIGGQNLETFQSVKYLGAVMADEGSKQEILSRIAQAVGVLPKLKTI